MQDTGKEKKSCFGCSVIAVCGWLVCAAMCLWLTISLEGYPKAYSLAYPSATSSSSSSPAPAARGTCAVSCPP